jgi:hypothetical protein
MLILACVVIVPVQTVEVAVVAAGGAIFVVYEVRDLASSNRAASLNQNPIGHTLDPVSYEASLQ